ncbi:MAG TPA: hypothetical protein PLS60_03385 [Arenimonas sp.]|nr:hypothetical protein [Arenimonas sp.]
MNPKRRRNALYAFVALALGSPAAHADVFDDAWSCAVAVKEGVVDTAIIGGKALKFIATKPDCVTRLGTPATAAPIGVVVGLANIGVLPKSQPSCSGKLYGTAAKPVAEALSATLGELGVLPDGAKDQLIGIAAGGISGEVLAEIPGMDFVSGSLTCGCDLVDAGLNTDTIEKVLNTADNIGDKCGGPVWDKAKEIAGDVVNFAGDAADEGIRQVSNLGDALAGQTKHMPYVNYYDQNWAPNVEAYATYEFSQPNSWHGAKKWKEIWDPCVSYFDGHTQAEDTAQYTCDNMRSGGPLFPKKYFGHELFERVFEFEASVLVNAEREKAYAEFADIKSGALPKDITDSLCYADQAIKLNSLLPSLRKQAIDSVFGIPKKEKKHNGLAVSPDSPPALWPADTFGAFVFTYFPEVDAGQFHADAGKAVQLASADFNAEEKVRAKLKELVLDYFRKGSVCLDTTDKNKAKLDSLLSQCPTQACKDTISSDYQVCSSGLNSWREKNMSQLTATEYAYNNVLLQNEQVVREGVCISEAEHTLTTEKNAETVENMVDQCSKSIPREKLEKDYETCAAAEETWYEKNRPATGKFTAEYVGKINEGWKGFNDACLEAAKTTFQSCRLSINDSSAKRPGAVEVPAIKDAALTDSSERLREREPIQRKDERVPKTETEAELRRRKEAASREPLDKRDPLQRLDDRVPRTDGSSESRRRRESEDSRESREPMRRNDERAPVAIETNEQGRRLSPEELRRARESTRQDMVRADDTSALEARRRAAAEARATREGRAGRDAAVPEAAPVTDSELPGCYVLSRTESSRYYGCRNSAAFDNCLVVVKRDSSIACKLVSKD